MLVVTAKFEYLPGKREVFLEEMEHLVNCTRKEVGCISFSLFDSQENPDHFMLFEEWEGPAAINYHKTTEHYKRFSILSSQFVAKKEATVYNVIKE